MTKRKAQDGQGELSPVMNRLLNASIAIQKDPDAAEKAYMARHLVQCTLPHSDPGDVPVWTRKNRNLTLTVQPLRDRTSGKALYPYGTIPRLLLYWIVTEATQKKSRRLILGNSLAAFMKELGLHTSGGKRGAPKRLREQMTRLLRATISFEQTSEDESWVDMQVGPVAQLWWNSPKVEQDALFDSWVELGEQFYAAVTSGPVPLDMRALRGLRKSPLALDLYSWFAYKTWVARNKGVAQPVTWDELYAQMGAEYAELRDFKKKVRALLRRIRGVYPAMKVEESAYGLLVKPSKTPVAPRRKTLPPNGPDTHQS